MHSKEERVINDLKYFISNNLNLAVEREYIRNAFLRPSYVSLPSGTSRFAVWEGIIEAWIRVSTMITTEYIKHYCTSPVIHVISEFAIERLELGSWAHIRNTKPPCKEKPYFQANKDDLVGSVSPLSSSVEKTIFSELNIPIDLEIAHTTKRMLIEDLMRKPREYSFQINATTDEKQNIMNGSNNKMKLELTRPVMVGNINILTASDETLTSLIRNAKAQIEEDSDMAKISAKFKAKAKDLKSVIALCLKQLDSGVVEEKPSA